MSGSTPPAPRLEEQVRESVAQAKEHFERGDYPLAASHLEQVVARGFEFADVHHMLGVIYHHYGEFEHAQTCFERALAINPGYVEAALSLAIVCNDLGQYDRAQEVYGAAVERARAGVRPAPGEVPLDSYTRGKLANLHASVGDAYQSVYRSREAVGEYRRALSLCPQFVDLRLKLANALREAGEVEASIGEYRMAVHHAPAYLPARVSLGIALYSIGKVDEAVREWEDVVTRDPSHKSAAMYLKLAKGPRVPSPARNERGTR